MQKSIKINKRRILFISLIMVILLSGTFLSLGLDTDEFRKSLKGKSNAELMERGRNYYRQNHMDSAMMVFTYIGDSYDPEMPLDEKRISLLAKNNVGIIYAFEYMDYKRGYEALTEAFELAESAGMEATQAVMCINIVELLRLYGICLQSENVSDRIDQYLRLGVKKALQSKEYRALASLIVNSMESDLSTPIEQFKAFENSAIPDTIEGVSYARAMLNAASKYQNNDPAGARQILEKGFASLPDFGRSVVSVMGYKMALAKIYAKEGNLPMAEKLAIEVQNMADSAGTLQNQLIALAFLSGLQVDNKEAYSRRLLQKKDSALSKGQLQMVSEIDFRRSLNREREENRRLSEERTRLFWSLGIGIILILTFGILIGLLVRNSRKLKERNASLYAKIQAQLAADTPPTPVKTQTAQTNTDNTKYAGSSLSAEKMKEIKSQLTQLLADEDAVCASDVSLAKIASRLNVNTTYLSRAVNECFGMSFSSLLNEYRIRIATRRMAKDSPYANQTIEAIARSVGYSSRSSFIAAFKKINGMTPSEYLKLSHTL